MKENIPVLRCVSPIDVLACVTAKFIHLLDLRNDSHIW